MCDHEVGDVGAGRTGVDEVAGCGERAAGIAAPQRVVDGDARIVDTHRSAAIHQRPCSRARAIATVGAAGDTPAQAWDAEKDFFAQPKSQLNAWEQLVQVLMLANEFMFVD